MPIRNVITWTTITSAHALHGHVKEALNLFRFMQLIGVRANKCAMVTILNACNSPAVLHEGRMIHSCISQYGLDSDIVVRNSMISMYGRCGDAESARRVFDETLFKDLVSWNAMISAYARNNQVEDAVGIYSKMQIKADKITYVALLAIVDDIGLGRVLQKRILDEGLDKDTIVCNSLITMYGRCGRHSEAREVFEKMKTRNVITWTSIISTYAKQKMVLEARELFDGMLTKISDPDAVSFATILNLFADSSALEQGKIAYEQAVKHGFEMHELIITALVNLYGKCGDLKQAKHIFNKIIKPDTEVYNTMIGGYAQFAQGKQAVDLFRRMEMEGVKPDGYTFVYLLLGCSHAGFFTQGRIYFTSMSEYRNVNKTLQHYGCVVDLLGRGGRLEEAEKFLENMPIQADTVGWTSLLGACRNHRDIERAKKIAKKLLEIEPSGATGYISLSNIYAELGKWNAVAKVRKLMAEHGVKKEAGVSNIEVGGVIHRFVSGDESHTETARIYQELERVHSEIKGKGYIPDTRTVMHFVEGKEKEKLLFTHSERLAIVYGLISTEQGLTLRVVKNLRVCSDCHTATKYISQVTQRRIVVRDSTRFHLFEEGKCSCQDYW